MTSAMNLKEPDQIDWNNYPSGSAYQAPPIPLGPDGKPIKYFGMVPQLNEAAFEADKEGNRQWVIDPLTITNSGQSVDGYKIRFTRINTRQFVSRKTGKSTGTSSVGNYLRSAGITAKPQKNNEYDAAVRATQGKKVTFTLDWEARNKDTGEQVKGYENFPLDPDRPGQRKAILKAGDTYKDASGAEQVVKSEVLFANARLKYFVDPSRK